MEEFPKIILPKDEKIVRALEEKLKEYRARLKAYDYTHPELRNKLTSSWYKAGIVERLLKDRELNTSQFLSELKEKEGSLDLDNYKTAVAVINDYIETGGKNVNGGTGFPLGEEKREAWKKRVNID